MKGSINSIGYICLVILTLVFLGQVYWFCMVKELKVNEIRYEINVVLTEICHRYWSNEQIKAGSQFGYGVKADGKTLVYGDDFETKEINLSSLEIYEEVGNALFYDYLYNKKSLDLPKMRKHLEIRLKEIGIDGIPTLTVRDSLSRQILMTTDSLSLFKNYIFTHPFRLGYTYNHELIAAVLMPSLLELMSMHLYGEGLLLLVLIICVFWQWGIIKSTYRNARVISMGIAHLEHEMKKPLAVMIDVLDGIIRKKLEDITEKDISKLKRVCMRLMKIAEMIDCMLTALKTAKLKIERTCIDIREELESIVEMFNLLKPYACIRIHMDENIGQPLLDPVYYGYMITNLIDNAIKYSGEHPEIDVEFRQEGTHWVLSVADNGIGMSETEMKKIFQQFYRSQNEYVTKKTTGFGLGLAFVKKVVDTYEGRIEVESELGKGSRFTVII